MTIHEQWLRGSYTQTTAHVTDHTSHVEQGAALKDFAAAILSGIEEQIETARLRLRERLKTDQFLDVVGVIALFNGINRVADATGTQLDAIWAKK